jgi:hypothetical protein
VRKRKRGEERRGEERRGEERRDALRAALSNQETGNLFRYPDLLS